MSLGPASSEPAGSRPASSGPASPGPASPGPVTADPSPAGWPQPIGKPPGAHWWSIQKPAPGEKISALRAYSEVLGVFAVFFAAGIVAGGETLAHRYPVPSGSWAVFTPAAISEVAMAILAVVVTTLLSARRGITPRSLGLGLPRKAGGGVAIWPAFRAGAWAIVALVVGGIITSAFATGHLGQPTRQDISYMVYATAASIGAAVVEETVVLAFLVTTLRQARRPLWEILIVAVLLRCSYHDYYGPGVVGIAVWAIIFMWLFLRSGSVVPLMIVHFLWDATIFWSQRWHWVNTARGAGALLVLIVAITSWLIDVGRRGRDRQSRPGGRSTGPYTAWPYPDQRQNDSWRPRGSPPASVDPGQLYR
jgi:membrane protease YdiL (CAAX protease family)